MHGSDIATGYGDLRSSGDVIDMVTERDEQIEEKLGPAVIHFKLHRSTALECAAAPDNESKVMCPQLGVSVGRVGVGIASRSQDGAALDSRFYR